MPRSAAPGKSVAGLSAACRWLALMAFSVALPTAHGPVAASDSSGGPPVIVVLGVSGADAAAVRRGMDDGRLPHLAALAAEGDWRPLKPAAPSAPLASWLALATGRAPAGAVDPPWRREPGTGQPVPTWYRREVRAPSLGDRTGPVVGLGAAAVLGVLLTWLLWAFHVPLRRSVPVGLGLAAVLAIPAWILGGRLVPSETEVLVPLHAGARVWDDLAAAGRTGLVFRLAVTYPARRSPGVILVAGPPMPDLDGGRSTGRNVGRDLPWMESDEAAAGEPVTRRFALPGPVDPAAMTRRLQEPVLVFHGAFPGRVGFGLQGRTRVLAAGETSDWLPVVFTSNPLVDRIMPQRGIFRVAASAAVPEIALAVSGVRPDPASPPRAVTWPHRPVDRGRSRPAAPMAAAEASGTEPDLEVRGLPQARALLASLSRDAEIAVDFLRASPGRSFLFMGLQGPGALEQRGLRAGPEVIDRVYQGLDRTVGRVRQYLPQGALLLVCSEPGSVAGDRSEPTAAADSASEPVRQAGILFSNRLLPDGVVEMTDVHDLLLAAAGSTNPRSEGAP